jgi:hypothetical protein
MTRNDYDAVASEEDEVDYDDGASNTEMTSLLVFSEATTVGKETNDNSFVMGQNNNHVVQNPLWRDTIVHQSEIEDRQQYGKLRKKSYHSNAEIDMEPHTEDVTYAVTTISTNLITAIAARCFFYRNFKSTLQCMNHMAKIVLWTTAIALVVAVIWYSYELHNHG